MKNRHSNTVEDSQTISLLASIEVKEKVFTPEQIDAAVESILEKIHGMPLQEAHTTGLPFATKNKVKALRSE